MNGLKSMSERERVRALLSWQSSALDVRDAGACVCCGEPVLFYRVPIFKAPQVGRVVQGWRWCASCDDAGLMRVSWAGYEAMRPVEAVRDGI